MKCTHRKQLVFFRWLKLTFQTELFQLSFYVGPSLGHGGAVTGLGFASSRLWEEFEHWITSGSPLSGAPHYLVPPLSGAPVIRCPPLSDVPCYLVSTAYFMLHEASFHFFLFHFPLLSPSTLGTGLLTWKARVFTKAREKDVTETNRIRCHPLGPTRSRASRNHSTAAVPGAPHAEPHAPVRCKTQV